MAAEKIAFHVLGELPPEGWDAGQTAHYKNDRNGRTDMIQRYIGFGKNVLAFLVDTHHPNGNECHVITDTGIIKIYNVRTHRHINDLIARPGQIRRYFPEGSVPNPYRYLLDIARRHQKAGYNNV